MKIGKFYYLILGVVLVIVLIIFSELFLSLDLNKTAVNLEKKIYFADNISSAHLKVINKFNERYEGQIEVVPVDLPFEKFSTNERKELLARYFRSKSERIDVFAVDHIWVPRFTKWSINLDEHISREQRNRLLKSALNSCTFHDSLYAVPLYIDISVLYYREDLLEQLSEHEKIINKLESSITWEEFIELNRRFKNFTNPFFLFQADHYEGLICIFSEMIAGQKEKFMEGEKIKLNTPEAKKSLQLLVDLVNKYNTSPPEVTHFKEQQAYDYYMKNNGVFLRGWPSFIDNYEDIPEYSEVCSHLRMAPTPHFKGQQTVSVFGGWNLMVSKFSSKTSEAIKFIKFVLSDEAQRIMFEEGFYLPINEEIYNDKEYMDKYPDLKFFRKLLEQGFHRPSTERYTNISDILSFYLNQAIKKEISVDEALTLASKKINTESFLLK